MKIATWNVNSVKARHDRVLAWLDRTEVDVLCLQELKVTDDAFDYDAFREAGFHAVVHGQKTYNGVAILCQDLPSDVRAGLGDDVDDPQARLVAATVAGVRVISAYFPNGQSVGSEKWDYKLAWMDRLVAYLAREADPAEPLVLCGDFNVALDDADVANPDSWADSVLCHGDGRAALARIREWGLVDAFRQVHPEGGIYSWWDYRRLGFPKNDGLRIDHVYATADLATTATAAAVDRDERKATPPGWGDAECPKPSDHAPVVVEFEL